MIRLRGGRLVKLLDQRPGAEEWSVVVDEDDEGGAQARTIAYPDLIGPLREGDRVLLNTTAVWLGLGTGGSHLVIAVVDRDRAEADPQARIMKLRYTPLQLTVGTVEDASSPHRGALEGSIGLTGTPVVWAPLHSMVGPVAAGARAAGAERVAYVMTDGAALPAGLSGVAASLRREGVIEAVISTGQAFGGDLEAVNVFTGLLAARAVAGADVIVVGDGPGNTGTGTTWGATDIESAMSLNAAAIVGGRPVAALRISFADSRERHRGVSHHVLTALSKVALVPIHVAVPSIEDPDRRAVVWDSLRRAGLHEQHQLVEASGAPALELLAARGIAPESMGRGVADDPEFFLAAGAAGVLAGRMAAGDRSWRPAPPGER